MGADNLNNVRGTQAQVYNALTDFTQHYFKSTDKGLDMEARMSVLPGYGPASMAKKYLKMGRGWKVLM